jgi:hypothetical protein
MRSRVIFSVALLLPAVVQPANAQQRDDVECTATLLEYQEGYPYVREGGGSFDHFSTERALYEVASPGAFAGRIIQIVFVAENEPFPQEPSSDDVGSAFYIRLPGDYFDHPDHTIVENGFVREIRMLNSVDEHVGQGSP